MFNVNYEMFHSSEHQRVPKRQRVHETEQMLRKEENRVIDFGPIPSPIKRNVLIPNTEMSLDELTRASKSLEMVVREGMSLAIATDYKLVGDYVLDPLEIACSRMDREELAMWRHYQSGASLPDIPINDPEIPRRSYNEVSKKVQRRTDAVRELYNDSHLLPYHYLYLALKVKWILPLVNAQARVTAAERERMGLQGGMDKDTWLETVTTKKLKKIVRSRLDTILTERRLLLDSIKISIFALENHYHNLPSPMEDDKSIKSTSSVATAPEYPDSLDGNP